MTVDAYKWMVVYTKPRWEKKVAEGLAKIGIENFCPINKELRQWSDRKKWVDVVVIPSYVFVRCNEKLRYTILQQPGVLNFVFWLGKPGVVRDEEMEALKRFISDHSGEEIEIVQLNPGLKVVIEGGPLNEQKGVVVDFNKKKVKIKLEGLGIALVSRSRLKVLT
jgi:transcription antitermination factor NusG